MKKFIYFFSLLFCSTFAFANDINKPLKPQVIYITLDGVRWQDVFLDHSHFKKFWQKHSKSAELYGLPDDPKTMQVASVPVSLPSYQSQTTGALQPCLDNNCGRVLVETFPEKIKEYLKLNRKEVAIFGSWYPISHSAEHIEGTVITNTGNSPMYDPDTGKPDREMQIINDMQLIDFPEDTDTRFDKYTVAQALHYFHKFNPRFMWLALNDSDEAAHANDKEDYHAALAFYDDVIDTLLTELKLTHRDKSTLVIITTDHGRGDGDKWTDHGPERPESKQTWAFVLNGALMPVIDQNGISEFNTLSIRPTIEKAMGLNTKKK